MNRKEHYQRMAGECLKLAHNIDNPINKALLLEMARTWANLAEQARQSEIDVLPSDAKGE